jgi:hypothetical protein
MDILFLVAISSGAEVNNLHAIFARGFGVGSQLDLIVNTHDVRKQTEPSQGVDCGLCGFCLLFPVHVGHERNVDECKVIRSNTELELPHRLNERRRLNVTNSSTQLEHAVNT